MSISEENAYSSRVVTDSTESLSDRQQRRAALAVVTGHAESSQFTDQVQSPTIVLFSALTLLLLVTVSDLDQQSGLSERDF